MIFFHLSTFPHCQIVFNEYILLSKQKINLKDTFLNALNWVGYQINHDVTNGLAENDQQTRSHIEGHKRGQSNLF